VARRQKQNVVVPVTAPQWRFTKAMIQDAPDCRGVYVLWRDKQALGVGHALGAYDTIRSRLLRHLSRAADADLGITHYSWQICSDPLKREVELSTQLGLVPQPAVVPTNTNTTCRHAESESSSSTT
jgi:hypothetical protein